MKKFYLHFIILICILLTNIYAQNNKESYTYGIHNNSKRYFGEKKDFIYENKNIQLNKRKLSTKQNLITYLPLIIHTINEGPTYRYENKTTYTYDIYGNLIFGLFEKLVNDNWINDERYTLTYDANGNMLTFLEEDWWAGDWFVDYKYSYTYDFDGNLISSFDELDTSKITYTYDTEGNMLTELIEEFKDGVWVINSRTSYTYDSNGHKLTHLSEQWFENTSVYKYKGTFTYDNYGNILTSFNEIWINGELVSSTNTTNTYTYDTNGNKLTSLEESNGSKEKWTYTYDNNNNVLTAFSENFLGEWTSNYMITYTYDANGNLLIELTQFRDTNKTKCTYEYDSNDNAIKANYFEWQNENWTVGSGNLTLYYNSHNNYYNFGGSEIEIEYTILTNVEEKNIIVNKFELYQNYPNPFNPSTVIKYQIPANAKSEMPNVKLVVYDILGNEIATLVNEMQAAGNYEVKFDASNLSSGVYIYQLQSGGFSSSKKMMLLK